MFNAIKAFALGLFAVVAVLGSAPAYAIPLTVGNFIVVDDYKYTLTQCNVAATCGNNGSFTAFGTSIKITGASGPFSTQGTNGAYPDTTIIFTVETLDGAYLNGVNLAIDGTATNPGDTNIGAGLKDFVTGNALYTGADPTVSGTGSGTVATVAKSFAATSNKATLKIDIATQPLTGTATTNYATAGVTRVPEPMSLLLLGSGVVAVMSARRRRLL